MDHGAVILHTGRGARRLATILLTLLALMALLALPASAGAVGATLVEPVDGHHFDHLDLAPMVQFDPSTGANGKTETPKWVLLASDVAMTKTVRYCRQFVWASAGGAFHWGCNKWATGVDQYNNDQLLALEAGQVYYWQVVSTGADGTGEVKSAVRSFAIDAEVPAVAVDAITAQVHGTAFDDGTQLNLGAAAFVNSGVKVQTVASSRLAPSAYRIRLAHVGAVDLTRSYIKLSSAAGTRYLPLAKVGASGAGTVWRLTTAERRLRTKRFTYQAFVKSTKNGAVVKSQLRVVVIRATSTPPKWTPDRTTVNPV